MEGRNTPRSWKDGGLSGVLYKLGDLSDIVSVEVNNVLVETKIHNVFGVIKGVTDAGSTLCQIGFYCISAIELTPLYTIEARTLCLLANQMPLWLDGLFLTEKERDL